MNTLVYVTCALVLLSVISANGEDLNNDPYFEIHKTISNAYNEDLVLHSLEQLVSGYRKQRNGENYVFYSEQIAKHIIALSLWSKDPNRAIQIIKNISLEFGDDKISFNVRLPASILKDLDIVATGREFYSKSHEDSDNTLGILSSEAIQFLMLRRDIK